MLWIETVEGELVNLARFDSVIINGQYNEGGRDTHWVEARRLRPDPNLDGKNDDVTPHLFFAYSEEECWDYIDKLKATLEFRGLLIKIDTGGDNHEKESINE